jgi:hypothetical protein
VQTALLQVHGWAFGLGLERLAMVPRLVVIFGEFQGEFGWDDLGIFSQLIFSKNIWVYFPKIWEPI